MKLYLPNDNCVLDWKKQSVCNEVEKINQERAKSGFDFFYTNFGRYIIFSLA